MLQSAVKMTIRCHTTTKIINQHVMKEITIIKQVQRVNATKCLLTHSKLKLTQNTMKLISKPVMVNFLGTSRYMWVGGRGLKRKWWGG